MFLISYRYFQNVRFFYIVNYLAIEEPYLNNIIYIFLRLAYPMFVINELLSKCQGKNIKLHVIYDIACVLQRHMQVSIFHKRSPVCNFLKICNILKIVLCKCFNNLNPTMPILGGTFAKNRRSTRSKHVSSEAHSELEEQLFFWQRDSVQKEKRGLSTFVTQVWFSRTRGCS